MGIALCGFPDVESIGAVLLSMDGAKGASTACFSMIGCFFSAGSVKEDGNEVNEGCSCLWIKGKITVKQSIMIPIMLPVTIKASFLSMLSHCLMNFDKSISVHSVQLYH